MEKENNIYPIFDSILTRKHREKLLNHKAKVIWFTGLSGSGKSTLATALEKELYKRGIHCKLLDGDNIRSGINNNLGFSESDRIENIRRIAEVCKLFLNAGVITLAAFISPTKNIRELARDIIGIDDFIEIYVNTPIEECERRDIKGLYAKARKGEIKDFTGVSAPFEEPLSPNIIVDTSKQSVEDSISKILNVILSNIKLNN